MEACLFPLRRPPPLEVRQSGGEERRLRRCRIRTGQEGEGGCGLFWKWEGPENVGSALGSDIL